MGKKKPQQAPIEDEEIDSDQFASIDDNILNENENE
jgi:hypothetical protein